VDAIDVAVATPPRATRARAWLPVAVGAAIIAVLLLRFGPEPFVDAFRRLDAWTLAAAAAVAAGSTVCAAYRWRVVAAGLRVPVGMGAAVRAYYTSQFLNATLPGGILGDVHRGLRQRRQGHPLGRSLRAVAWERTLGQVAQVLLTAGVLLAVPSPWRPPAAVGLGLVAAGAVLVGLALLARRRPDGDRPDAGSAQPTRPDRHGTPRTRPAPHRPQRLVGADWRDIRGVPGALPRIGIASVGAACGHLTVFLLAARSVAPHLAFGMLVPVALLVLVIGALPVNIAGWGPREGAAAWAFGSAGLGAAQGLSVSVLFGVLALAGTLPGAVLLARRERGGRHA
jgi:uncharacterized membrane protein YbhN (UPF0104 family)